MPLVDKPLNHFLHVVDVFSHLLSEFFDPHSQLGRLIDQLVINISDIDHKGDIVPAVA